MADRMTSDEIYSKVWDEYMKQPTQKTRLENDPTFENVSVADFDDYKRNNPNLENILSSRKTQYKSKVSTIRSNFSGSVKISQVNEIITKTIEKIKEPEISNFNQLDAAQQSEKNTQITDKITSYAPDILGIIRQYTDKKTVDKIVDDMVKKFFHDTQDTIVTENVTDEILYDRRIKNNPNPDFCFLNDLTRSDKHFTHACIDSYDYNGQNTVCNNFDMNNCHVSTSEENQFYERMGYNNVRFNIDVLQQQIITNFNEFLTETIDPQREFSIDFNDVYDIDDLESLGKVYFISKLIGNKYNNTQCNDTIVEFSQNCKYQGNQYTGKGTQKTVPFFHISIHSKKPKYIEGSPAIRGSRSNYICAYYKKSNPPPTAAASASVSAAADDDIGSGPFHYKIEHIRPASEQRFCEGLPSGATQPFKKFTITNYIFFENNNCSFEKDGVINSYYSATSPDELKELEDKKQKLLKIHNYIYNLFVFYWNTEIIKTLVYNDPTVWSTEFHNTTNTWKRVEPYSGVIVRDCTTAAAASITTGLSKSPTGGSLKHKKLTIKHKKFIKKHKRFTKKYKKFTRKRKNKSKKTKYILYNIYVK